jgi:hypothetical protein
MAQTREIYYSIRFSFASLSILQRDSAGRKQSSLLTWNFVFIEGITFRAHVNENFIKLLPLHLLVFEQGNRKKWEVPGILKLQGARICL